MRWLLARSAGLCACFLLSASNAIACDVIVAGSASEVVSQSSVIFWGIPIEAHLLGDSERTSADRYLADSYNGIAVFEVQHAVKGAAQREKISAYFVANGTSCDMPVTIGRDGFYFMQKKNDGYVWGQYTQPDWFSACKDYLDVFETELGVEFPLLRERIPACRIGAEQK